MAATDLNLFGFSGMWHKNPTECSSRRYVFSLSNMTQPIWAVSSDSSSPRLFARRLDPGQYSSFDSADSGLVPLVKRPLLDSPGADKARLQEDFHVFAGRFPTIRFGKPRRCFGRCCESWPNRVVRQLLRLWCLGAMNPNRTNVSEFLYVAATHRQ